MPPVSYEQFIENAKKAADTIFEFKCPICGSPCTETLAQFNLSRRYPCENCNSIITVGKGSYDGESLKELEESRNKIREISTYRRVFHEDKIYDGIRVKMQNNVPSIFGFTLKLE